MLWFILPSCLQKPCLEIKLRMRLSMWIWRVVLVPSELFIFSVSRPQALLCGWREKARSGPQFQSPSHKVTRSQSGWGHIIASMNPGAQISSSFTDLCVSSNVWQECFMLQDHFRHGQIHICNITGRGRTGVSHLPLVYHGLDCLL